MIPADVMAGEVPPAAAIVEVLHPRTLDAAVAIVTLTVPDGWTAALGCTPCILLTDPESRVWSILQVDDDHGWCSWPEPGVSLTDDGTIHPTAQHAADTIVRRYRSGIAAVAS